MEISIIYTSLVPARWAAALNPIIFYFASMFLSVEKQSGIGLLEYSDATF